MIRWGISAFLPRESHILGATLGKKHVQVILNDYLTGSVPVDVVLEREILMQQLIEYLKELLVGVVVFAAFLVSCLVIYWLLKIFRVPAEIAIACKILALWILCCGEYAAIRYIYKSTREFIRSL